MAQYYSSDDKLPILHTLITKLDLTLLDTGNLVSLCMEHKLHLGLIYICTRGNDDFLTPLVKLSSIY